MGFLLRRVTEHAQWNQPEMEDRREPIGSQSALFEAPPTLANSREKRGGAVCVRARAKLNYLQCSNT